MNPNQICQLLRTAGGYPLHVERRIVDDVQHALAFCPTLTPGVGVYAPSNGTAPQRLVRLDGTVPFAYAGATYHLPVQLWVLTWYPTCAPVAYIVPTASMIIARGHRHVDTAGLVYLPELSKWDPAGSTLSLIIARMTAVFSEITPVYTRKAGKPRPPACAVEQPLQRQNPAQGILSGSDGLASILADRAKKKLCDKGEEAEIEIFGVMQEVQSLEQALDELDIKLADAQFTRRQFDDQQAQTARLLGEIEAYDMNGGDIPLELAFDIESLKAQQFACIVNDHAIQNTMETMVAAVGKRIVSGDVFIRESYDLGTEQYMARALYSKLKAIKSQREGQSASGAQGADARSDAPRTRGSGGPAQSASGQRRPASLT